jgi:hypothetical protein
MKLFRLKLALARGRVNSAVMPLTDIFKRHLFVTCFVISVAPFVFLNLFSFVAAYNCCEGDSFTDAGFPLVWYTTGGFVMPRHVIWNAVFLDAIVVTIVGLVSARILKSVFRPT